MISDELVKRAVNEMRKNIANCRYFFDQMKSPEWIPHLVSNGLFSDPPPAERSGNTISFPIWPASQYLARMAPLAPDQVLRILLRIPETDNVRVHLDLIKTASSLPPRLAAQWAAKEIAWCEKQDRSYLLLYDDLAELMTHLARGGETASAIGLARTILSLSPDPRTTTTQADNGPFRPAPEPRTRFDVWMYKKIVDEHVPTLVEKCGMQAFSLLVELLESAVRLSQHPEEVDSEEDYSFVWRPAIEDHEQNHDHEVKDWLVTAVRDAAARLIPSEGVVVLQRLEQRRYKVFKRLALHFRREFSNLDFVRTAQMMVDPTIFADSGFRHEYYRLLEAHFGRLSGDVQSQYYELVEKGPEWKAGGDEHEVGEPQTDTVQIAAAARGWQRNKLWPIREFLSEPRRQHLEAIVSECGEPFHPDFTSYRTGVQCGPNSPKSDSELKEMSIDELVEFLRSFTEGRPPGSNIDEPSAEGLGRVLTVVVAEEPRKYADAADRFRGLDPTYVRAILQGLRQAPLQDRPFSWSQVLTLCQWAVQQQREIPGRKGRLWDIDPDWGWTRKAIADLLIDLCNRDQLSQDHRNELWGVFETLTNDPDPTPEDERRLIGRSPAQYAINTTRGRALQTVIQYASWVRRQAAATPGAESAARNGLDDLPEVRAVLDRHLDPAIDPSLAIRSVYGEYLPWLHSLDHNWVGQSLSRIFPSGESPLWDAAWDTYVTFCPVYDAVFSVLHAEYERAIERLGTGAQEADSGFDPEEKLVDHLLMMYLRGKLTFGDDQSLLSKFYRKATPRLRARAITFVGHVVHDSQEALEEDILYRIRILWEIRLAACKTASDPAALAELLSFGWWFASGKFADTWAFQQLEQVLLLTHQVEPDHMVVERLATVTAAAPAPALNCLRLLIEGDNDGWRVLGWSKEIRTVLQAALHHGDDVTKAAAVDLVHRLGAKGYSQFRDLVS
jgi:hypothetical protein